ncbi:MAG: winged helix-turn-helix domain-containing protein [Candidatus Heimdallarchaeaceae archaeon]
MPARNRTRYDIYADIMLVLRFYGKAGISQIARRANLPVDRAKSIVEFMCYRGLLLKEKNTTDGPVWLYSATERGFRYLALYKELSRLVAELTPEELDLLEELV